MTRLGIADLEARLAVHRNTVGDWVRAARFPRPHYIGERRKWWEHEVAAWEAANASRSLPRARQPPRRGSAC